MKICTHENIPLYGYYYTIPSHLLHLHTTTIRKYVTDNEVLWKMSKYIVGNRSA